MYPEHDLTVYDEEELSVKQSEINYINIFFSSDPHVTYNNMLRVRRWKVAAPKLARYKLNIELTYDHCLAALNKETSCLINLQNVLGLLPYSYEYMRQSRVILKEEARGKVDWRNPKLPLIIQEARENVS